MSDFRKGVLYGASSYFMWGFLPLYWPLLTPPATAFEVLLHRMIWSLVVTLVVLLVQRNWQWIRGVLRSPRRLLLLLASAALISLNWGAFITAVTTGHTLQSALAYFINPLVSVALGLLVFKERLRPGQWAALLLGVLAVAVLTVDYGSLPWLALAMAFSFAVYGALKKFVGLDGVESLSAETAVLFLPALGGAVYLEVTGTGTFTSVSPLHALLLVGAGVVTAAPLMLFGAAAHRIPLTLVGLLQFMVPVMHFLIAWLVFGEDLSLGRWIGFAVVWTALVVFVVDMLRHARHTPRPAPSAPVAEEAEETAAS
ncbi:EamA family transporter RarD [Thermobifida fusca]|jgi:chloramphenicol-sensitive protein RarD|nr:MULTISPECIES: EamA family transporter RarD [Thermobifida]AAZ56712.1 RarD protein [Thermobifida fusca YX]MBO2528973.1 EamA family transporter RarD [Thermobifida sp.]MDD6793784.1 EamA family transporter RarD [Thermobifida fusca]PPS95306.1 protein rarD [Thermobifida fusca]PZN66959.1 MAG: EamA family transporter RarD [Thermobifida fusca]